MTLPLRADIHPASCRYRADEEAGKKSCYLLATSDVRRDFEQAGISMV